MSKKKNRLKMTGKSNGVISIHQHYPKAEPFGKKPCEALDRMFYDMSLSSV